MNEPLAAIRDWPVGTAAAAVVGPGGVLASAGPDDQQFALASVTKPLAAVALLIAVEEEALSLDDPADEQLLPGATLRHLLAHASGVAPEQRVRSFAPAYRRVYSNVGIEMAARHLETATDIAFADYLNEAVFGPLGMTHTSLFGSPARDGISTVADLTRFASELLTQSGLLSSAMHTDLRTVQYPGLRGVLPGYGGQDPNDWGLGVEIRGAKTPHWTGARNSLNTFGHFGQSGTMLWVDPEAQLALIALADKDFGDWAREAWPALSDAVLDRYGS